LSFTANVATEFVSSAPDQQPEVKDVPMNKSEKSTRDEMRDEYDFSGGERGKYAKKYEEGSNVVVLDPDVARLFSDSASVNRALRTLAEIAEKQAKKATG